MLKMFRTISLVCSLFVTIVMAEYVQSGTTNSSINNIIAYRIEKPIEINGLLDEPEWQHAYSFGDFVQYIPNPGQEATESTEVMVLYDDQNLYIGIRLFDGEPEGIIGRLGRRDDDDLYSDWVSVLIDSDLDRRTAFRFSVNPAGVQQDGLFQNDDMNDYDDSWRGVWEAATFIHSDGWNAEFRIPFSQLRLGGTTGEIITLGINFEREIARKEEKSFWIPVHPEDGRFVSVFGFLTDIEIINAPIGLEVIPYITSQAEILPANTSANPLLSSPDYTFHTGVDLRYGLPKGLTLSATINPDFGQVEVDPAVVNLTAFEVFYPEKRPFFTEGSSYFRFGTTPNVLRVMRQIMVPGNEGLLYSRRIGRAPQGSTPGDAIFVNIPQTTRILGAAKLAGRTPGGWSIGMMNALTKRMHGLATASDDTVLEFPVEPLTNYAAARLSKNYRDGESSVGIITTAVNRESLPLISHQFPNEAYTFGIDGRHRFSDSDYMVAGWIAGSRLVGEAGAISRLQTAPGRYFNRPNAKHLEFDPHRTNLNGIAGSVGFGKIGGKWRTGFQYETRSPGFETNELGYLYDTDWHMAGGWIGYIDYSAGSYIRQWTLFSNVINVWNWGGERIENFLNLNGNILFQNNWSLDGGIEHHFYGFDVDILRGGPGVRRNPRTLVWLNIITDRRKAISGFIGNSHIKEYGTGGSWTTINSRLLLRPSGWLTFSVRPSIGWRDNPWQWVTDVASFDIEKKYLVGKLSQRTLIFEFRVGITPANNFSIDVFMQPLVSKGEYSSFRTLGNPKARNFDDRFILFSNDELRIIDTDDKGRRLMGIFDPITNELNYTFTDPGFVFTSFRMNAVIRWEYRPGSEVYFVLQQGRQEHAFPGETDSLLRFFQNMGSISAHNIFLIKWTYWIGS